ncbi:MFS transporter [Pseudalkalibacillus berkeleyi]|uniref:MFS transporter n=1 Tax=Pseudalkalibacillus berkeleyi TaxID=1069813 RepID=A0ABS9GXC1_9BACL|nr:MFS transporter [Pseudalkalibacillus berkeleyi]MCF6136335.1 MFS transporter [Pseudalkalibacillus berkeleyi]
MKFKEFHPNVQIRIVVQFLSVLASTSIIPFLAIYFAKTIGETLTGFFYILVILSGVIGGLIGGHLSDKLGRKKLMVLSESVVLITYMAITLVNSPWIISPYTTITLFMINMFFSGIFLPAAQAMMIDVSTPQNRKYIYGFSYWANNLAMAIGGIVGAFLFASHKFELFIFISSVTFVSLMATILFIQESYTPPSHSSKEPHLSKKTTIFHTYTEVFKDRIFLLYITASILILSIEMHLTNYIGIRLEQNVDLQTLFSFQEWSLEVDGIRLLGFLKTENTLFVAFLAGAVTLFIKRLKDRWSYQWGAFLFVSGFTVLSFSLNPWILFIAIGIASIGELMYIPVKQAYLANLAPDHARSSYMAIDGFSYYFASIVGALFITLGTLLSAPIMSFIIFTSGLLGIFCFSRVMTNIERREEGMKEKKAM